MAWPLEPELKAIRRVSGCAWMAPSGSTIIGVTQSIEPSYKHLYVKSNLSGEFTQIDIELVSELKSRGLWDQDMLDAIKYYDGSLVAIERIPDDIKARYLTAFEVHPAWIIECAARRQKWIDMGQSLNLYMQEPSGKKLHEMYFLAGKTGCKTTYYLRSQGATHVEKSTGKAGQLNAVPTAPKAAIPTMANGKVCDRSDPTCEACQ